MRNEFRRYMATSLRHLRWRPPQAESRAVTIGGKERYQTTV